MELPDKAFVAAIASIEGIGARQTAHLVDVFGGAVNAWQAPEQEVRSRLFPENLADRFLSERSFIDVEANYLTLQKESIDIVSICEEEYPRALKEISSPPAVLYIKGRLPNSCLTHVAVVGTRRATLYGRKIAERLCSQLAERGIVVVSGMARGIDTCAHKGAVHSGGYTVAVLGCGLDIVYPKENQELMEQIIERGAVISEFPLGTPPERTNFPARNRIISGLSRGVLVVEAPEKSGALITADFALEQGREVFAVPGPINSANSRGCHSLLKQGAKLTENVQDILEELETGFQYTFPFSQEEENSHSMPGTSDREMEEVIALLAGGPAAVDEICEETGKSPSELNRVLTKMELEGLIIKAEGKIHIIT